MIVSLIILKFQSIFVEDNRISASLLALPSLTTHYYAVVLFSSLFRNGDGILSTVSFFPHAKKAFQRGSLTIARLWAITMGWDKKERDTGERERKRKISAEMWPYQLTVRPWEISWSPSGTKIVQFTSPPALSTGVDWWHAAFFSFRDEVCHQTGGSEL